MLVEQLRVCFRQRCHATHAAVAVGSSEHLIIVSFASLQVAVSGRSGLRGATVSHACHIIYMLVKVSQILSCRVAIAYK